MCILCRNRSVNSDVVDCSGCSVIEHIVIAKTVRLICNDCPNLTIISGVINELICNRCVNLRKINTTETNYLECNDCINLTNIKPIKQVYCNRTGIQKLIGFNRSTILDCSDCPNLTLIKDIQCTVLRCNNCPNLRSVFFVYSDEVHANNCLSLNAIQEVKTHQLHCSFCPLLRNVDHCIIDDLFCTNCNKLYLDLDTVEIRRTLDCSNCQNIGPIISTNINTDPIFTHYSFEYLKCSNCPNVRNIRGLFKKIVCDGCVSLDSIEINNTLTYLNCSDCPNLRIDGEDDTSLNFLNVSYCHESVLNNVFDNLVVLVCLGIQMIPNNFPNLQVLICEIGIEHALNARRVYYGNICRLLEIKSSEMEKPVDHFLIQEMALDITNRYDYESIYRNEYNEDEFIN